MAVTRENITVWYAALVWEEIGENRDGHHAKAHKCFKEVQISIPNSYLGHRGAAQELGLNVSWCQRWVQVMQESRLLHWHVPWWRRGQDLPLRFISTWSTGHGYQWLFSWPCALCQVLLSIFNTIVLIIIIILQGRCIHFYFPYEEWWAH